MSATVSLSLPMFAGSRASVTDAVRDAVPTDHMGAVVVDITATHAMSGAYADELLVELLVRRDVSIVAFVSDGHDWDSQVGKISARDKLLRQARIHGVEARVIWHVDLG